MSKSITFTSLGGRSVGHKVFESVGIRERSPKICSQTPNPTIPAMATISSVITATRRPDWAAPRRPPAAQGLELRRSPIAALGNSTNDVADRGIPGRLCLVLFAHVADEMLHPVNYVLIDLTVDA
jgi:hypothetical protein